MAATTCPTDDLPDPPQRLLRRAPFLHKLSPAVTIRFHVESRCNSSVSAKAIPAPDSAALDELLYAIYQGTLEERPWQSFLSRLRESFAASHATLLLRPPRQGDAGVVLNAVVVSPEVFDDYNHNWFALDPFVDLPGGEVYTLREFVPAEDLAASAYYRDYVWSLGVIDIMGADLDSEGMSARLRLTRSQGAGPFSEGDKAALQRLLRHLQLAIALHARLSSSETERQVFDDTMDRLATGVVILDSQAGILRTNQAAERLLGSSSILQVHQGRLRLRQTAEQRAFRELFDAVVQAHLEGQPDLIRALRIATSDGGPGVGLLLRPLPRVPAADWGGNASVAVFLSDPSQRRSAPTEVLIQLFGFTPAESALALLLANGSSLDEAAGELDISRNTAKSHLSAIYAKTGVSRQGKLVQLLLKSVAPFAAEADTPIR